MKFVPVTHLSPLTTIRRVRLLPVKGKVLVRKGQKVEATEVVARASHKPQHVLLDLAKGLGLPAEKVGEHLKRHAGEAVSEGDVIAGPVGITRRVVRAPQNGRIVIESPGQVLLELETEGFELRAGIPGTVAVVEDERGVIIETTGALLQGVWGNGKLDNGLLHVIAHNALDILNVERLDVSLRGGVVAAGFVGDAAVLQAAAELPVRGLVLASMDAGLASIAMNLNFPVILMEGFGLLGMSTPAFRILSNNNGQQTTVNAQRLNPYAGERPEVIIPISVQEATRPLDEYGKLSSGATVRILRAPYRSQIGVVKNMKTDPNRSPGSLAAEWVEVKLETGEDAIVPAANLEIIL